MEKFSVAIQVLPAAKDQDDMLRIVDHVISYIGSFGVHYVVTPFETVIEGDFDTLMKIVATFQQEAIKAGAKSTLSYLKMNYCPDDGILSIDEKTGKYSK